MPRMALGEEFDDEYDEEIPHNYHKPIMVTVYRYIMINKGNILIGITGRVRHGKSHTAIHILKRWNKKLPIKMCLVYTVSELMKRTLNCIFIDDKPLDENTYMSFSSVDEMNAWLNKMQTEGRMRIKPGRAIVFDEAGAGVFVRSFFSQDNITISKVVQLWGMLRMLVIVVVPEHMGIAEKNLRQFMDVEIRMHHVYKSKGFATCTAYEYYDKSDPDNPKKRRVPGCKYGGKIKVTQLHGEDAKEYEDISRVMKVSALLELARGKPAKGEGGTGQRVTYKDYQEKFNSVIDSCRNPKGKLDPYRIKVMVGCGLPTARDLIAAKEHEEEMGITV